MKAKEKARHPLRRGCLIALLLVVGYVFAVLSLAYIATLPAGKGAQCILMQYLGFDRYEDKLDGAQREARVLARDEYGVLCTVWAFELPEDMARLMPVAQGESMGSGKWRAGPTTDAQRRDLLSRLGFPEAALDAPADPGDVYESRYRLTMRRSRTDDTVVGHLLALYDADTRRLLVYDLRTSPF